MYKKNPVLKKVKKVIAPHQTRNDHEREEAKKKGTIFGYLKFPSGRKTNDAAAVHMPGEVASRLRLPEQPASKLRDDAVVVHPPGRPASKLKWRGNKAYKKNPA